MKHQQLIIELAKNNNGVVTSRQIDELEIPRACLKYLVDSNKLNRAMRGIYTLPDFWEDDMYYLQLRFTKGIFGLNTALFLHDLTDRTPMAFDMIFPNNYNISNILSENVKVKRSVLRIHRLGVIEVKTQYGNTVNVYDEERTLCDLLRPVNNVDIQVITDAYKQYFRRKSRNINKLIMYAKALHVEHKLRSYLEVLL
mgnify:CR=1 FL=1